MTEDEIRSMDAGPEMNRAIAENVFGYVYKIAAPLHKTFEIAWYYRPDGARFPPKAGVPQTSEVPKRIAQPKLRAKLREVRSPCSSRRCEPILGQRLRFGNMLPGSR